jgi:hypothetical protein
MTQAAHAIQSIWPYKSRESGELPGASRRPMSQRGIGLRAVTSFPVLFCEGPHAAHCLAMELSATGIVVERGRPLSERELHSVIKLELFLPDQLRPVRVLARVARQAGKTAYALRFVLISDVDRLTLMEHLDHEQLRTLRLLDELEALGHN